MTDAAITAIKTETSRTKLMILPSFFKSLMLAIDDITLMPISGTIIINSKLRKIAPIGSNLTAMVGKKIPIAPPISKASSNKMDDR